MLGHLDCSSGVSGDKMLGALLDAGLSLDLLRDRLAGLRLAGWEVSVAEGRRGGLRGSRVEVAVASGQPARSAADIATLLTSADLEEQVRGRAIAAFDVLAEAESRVHGLPIDEVHFHEVGAIDSIVDIVGAAIGLDALGIDELWATPVCLGHGTVRTAHGVLPVPAPATAELLRGAPTYAGSVEAEMTTPTGAALLRTFVTRYAPAPLGTAAAHGYGAGTRDTAIPNLLRLTLIDRGTWDGADEQVTLLESLVDHLAPEHLASALDLVRDAGALDVWQASVVAKKGRLAAHVTVMVRPEDAPRLTDELMRQTGTLGVRRTDTWRSVASRRVESLETEMGTVRVKVGGASDSEHSRPEADDIARIAAETGRGVADVVQSLSRCGMDAGAPPETE